jgi:hypothetical protein
VLAGAVRTGVLPCDIASTARQVLWSTFTAPVGWKSTAFHPEVRAVHRGQLPVLARAQDDVFSRRKASQLVAELERFRANS